MGLADIARAKQIQKQLDRLQSAQDAEERDRHAYKFATYQGKDPVDGTDIVEVNGAKTSGFKLMSNAPLSIGDRVNLRPNQQGLQRVDAKNVAPVVVDEIPIDDTYPIIKLQSLGLLAWTGSSFLSIGSEIARIKTNGRSVVIGELTITGGVIGYSVARQEIYLLDDYNVLVVKDEEITATIPIPMPAGEDPYMTITSSKYIESLDKICLGVIEVDLESPSVTTRSIRIVDPIARTVTRVEVFVNNKDDGGDGSPDFSLGAYGGDRLLFYFRHSELTEPEETPPDIIENPEPPDPDRPPLPPLGNIDCSTQLTGGMTFFWRGWTTEAYGGIAGSTSLIYYTDDPNEYKIQEDASSSVGFSIFRNGVKEYSLESGIFCCQVGSQPVAFEEVYDYASKFCPGISGVETFDEYRYYYTYGFLNVVGNTATKYTQLDQFTKYSRVTGLPDISIFYAFQSVYGRSIFNAITGDFLANIVYRDDTSSYYIYPSVASVDGGTIARHPELSTATIFADSVKGNIFGVNYSPRSLIKLAAASKEILATKNLPVKISFSPIAPYIIYCPSINRIYVIGLVDSGEDSAAASGKTTWLIPFNLSTGRFN